MTLLSLDASVTADLKDGKLSTPPSHDASSSSSPSRRALPRSIHLRKRPSSPPSNKSNKAMNLTSVNSAFLSGLFADVAMVRDEVTCGYQEQAAPPPPCKKMRLTKTKSLSRSGRSFKMLSEALGSSSTSSKAPARGVTPEVSPTSCNHAYHAFAEDMCRQDSLHDQLNHVSSGTDVSSATNLAFPRLHRPTAVSRASDSSCKGITQVEEALSSSSSNHHLIRVISDLQSSVDANHESKQDEKESYGWFVEMEDPTTKTSRDHLAAAAAAAVSIPTTAAPSSSGTHHHSPLAFSAHVAPKQADDHDAELEWAKAADTVDDVLGDFF